MSSDLRDALRTGRHSALTAESEVYPLSASRLISIGELAWLTASCCRAVHFFAGLSVFPGDAPRQRYLSKQWHAFAASTHRRSFACLRLSDAR